MRQQSLTQIPNKGQTVWRSRDPVGPVGSPRRPLRNQQDETSLDLGTGSGPTQSEPAVDRQCLACDV